MNVFNWMSEIQQQLIGTSRLKPTQQVQETAGKYHPKS